MVRQTRASAKGKSNDASARDLAGRIASAPVLSTRKEARDKFEAWLAETAESGARRSLKALLADLPKVEALLRGLADHSPYLWDLVCADAARLISLLQADPDERYPQLLRALEADVAAARGEGDVMRILRAAKAEAALLIALADIGGVWDLSQVTRALTQLADRAAGTAVRYLMAAAVEAGKLKPATLEHPEQDSGYIVLAMGKMGAFELNYSSDIDLIVFFDPAAPALVDPDDALQIWLKVTRGLVRLLGEHNADGYVFRVDLRLRPDPSSTHIAVSTPAALEYYEGRGQNWERSAMIKARPCAGDIPAGEALLKNLAPFVWRKYMDFAALADIHAMKRQIHAYRGHGEIAVEGHNVKLGRGGIREIEFFVQTQQLIAGGRHAGLRDRGTLATLSALAEGGWVGPQVKRDMEAAYLFLRMVEHRLQMVADEQTHELPEDRAVLEGFARFCGFADADSFGKELLGHLRKVQGHYSQLFENAPLVAAGQRKLVISAESPDRATLDNIAGMGFRNPIEVSERIRQWLSGDYRSLRGEMAREQLAELVPTLLDHLAGSENRDVALIAFDRFLSGLHGAGRLFSLLRKNPDLVALIALTISAAPRLADTLAHYPQMMDGLIDPTFFGALPDDAKLTAQISRSLGEASSYEDFLDRLRLFSQEHMFLVGTRILSGTVTAGQAGEAFARLAEVVIRALHRAIEERFATPHGRVRGQQTALLAMGKLGGREMTASSDLDLILVYEFDEAHPNSDGARPLYGAQYFARLTQRLISALTSQTNYGALYAVDMRLRPSGRSGPVATEIDAFREYQESEAWTWEHMALTRARVVSASPSFGQQVQAVIRNVLCRRRNADTIAADAFEMRAAIAKEKGDSDRWDIKYAVGGLIDLEFIAQYLQLAHAADKPDILDTNTGRALEKAARLGALAAEDAEVLRPAARLYQDIGQILRLCLSGPFEPRTADPGLLALLARAADVPDFAALEAYLSETQDKVRKSFNRIVGREGG